jgi:hypothetical protein
VQERLIRYYMNPALTPDRNACRFRKEFVPVLEAGRHQFFREPTHAELAALKQDEPVECKRAAEAEARKRAALEAKRRAAIEAKKRLALKSKKGVGPQAKKRFAQLVGKGKSAGAKGKHKGKKLKYAGR